MPTWESEAVENPLWLDTSNPSAPELKKYEPTTGGWVGTTGVDAQARADLADIATFTNYSTVLTKDANGNVAKVELKDGATVIQTTNITRDSSGNVISVEDIANGKTVTTIINRASDGTVSSTSKAVV